VLYHCSIEDCHSERSAAKSRNLNFIIRYSLFDIRYSPSVLRLLFSVIASASAEALSAVEGEESQSSIVNRQLNRSPTILRACYALKQIYETPPHAIYNRVLRQSVIKQQSVFVHSPFDHPKHGVHPSAVWIAWIRSAFFIFPGLIPSFFAFVFISGIPIRFSATLVAAILCLSFYSVIYFYKYFVLQPTYFYPSSAKHHLIYFEHLRRKVEKKCAFLRTFTRFLQIFTHFPPFFAIDYVLD